MAYSWEHPAINVAVGTAGTNGDNTLVAAVASKVISVLSFKVTTLGTTGTTTTLEDGVNGTVLDRGVVKDSGTGWVEGPAPVNAPLFKTSVNTLLNMTNDSGDDLEFRVTYLLEDA